MLKPNFMCLLVFHVLTLFWKVRTVLLPEACFDDWDSDKKHDYSLKGLYWFFKYFLSLGLRLGLLTISLIGGIIAIIDIVIICS